MHRRATSSPVVTGLFVAALAAIVPVATSSACGTAGRTAAAPAACAPTVTASAPAPVLPVPSASLANPAVPLYLAVTGAPAMGGMMAYLDPETGEIGGMPSPMPAGLDLASPEGLTVADLVEEQAWDGSWMVNLRGLFQDYAVVRFDATGHAVVNCGPDARVMLAAPLPAVPVVEE